MLSINKKTFNPNNISHCFYKISYFSCCIKIDNIQSKIYRVHVYTKGALMFIMIHTNLIQVYLTKKLLLNKQKCSEREQKLSARQGSDTCYYSFFLICFLFFTRVRLNRKKLPMILFVYILFYHGLNLYIIIISLIFIAICKKQE